MATSGPPRALPRGLAAALLLVALAGCGETPVDAPRETSLSLLAVGDTGKPREFLDAFDPSLAVAAAMAAEDERSPVDAVVLLGDNFYPEGLEKRELKDRLRANVVGPFCHFVELTARGAGSLGDACPEAEARHPVPLFAVLGNHDYGRPESPDLQRKEVPEYVASWQMPSGDVEVRELAGGVSLILLDTNHVGRQDGDEAVVRALAGSRGPWRVMAAHHPILDVGGGYDRRFEKRMRKLLKRAGVPVHVYLAGHEHNLQAFVAEAPEPALQLVAGSGSDLRPLDAGDPRRRYGSAAFGFVRLDAIEGAEPRLVARLLEVPAPPLPSRAREVARFEVDRSGAVSTPPAGAAAAP